MSEHEGGGLNGCWCNLPREVDGNYWTCPKCGQRWWTHRVWRSPADPTETEPEEGQQ